MHKRVVQLRGAFDLLEILRISEIPESDYANTRTARARLIIYLRSCFGSCSFSVFGGGHGRVSVLSSHAVSLEFVAAGIVNDPIENGVGDGGFANHVMPTRDGQLGGDDGGSPMIALIEELEQIEPLLVGQPMRAPVVEDQQLDVCQLVDEAGKAPIEARHDNILEERRHPDIRDRVIETSRLMGEGACQPGLAGASLTCEDHLLPGLDPVALCEHEDLAAIKPTAGGKIDIFDAGIGKTHPRVVEPVGEAFVGAVSTAE